MVIGISKTNHLFSFLKSNSVCSTDYIRVCSCKRKPLLTEQLLYFETSADRLQTNIKRVNKWTELDKSSTQTQFLEFHKWAIEIATSDSIVVFLRPNLEKKGSTAKSGVEGHLSLKTIQSSLESQLSMIKRVSHLKNDEKSKTTTRLIQHGICSSRLTSHRFTSHVWLIIRISVSSNAQSSRIFAVYLVCYISLCLNQKH